jgi:hypothetical protein
MGPLLVGLALIAAACSATSQETTAPPEQAPESIWDLDREAGDLVLHMSETGGFPQQGDLLTRLPVFAMYEDGSLLVPGRIEAANQMIRPLMRLQVDDTILEQVNELVEEMGLREVYRITDDSLVGTLIDGATTMVTYFDEYATAHHYSAYGLSSQTGVPLPPDSGFLPETAALAELASMFSQAGADAAAVLFEPERIQLFRIRTTSDGEVQPWPLDVVPSDFTASPDPTVWCLIVRDQAARETAEALADTDHNVTFDYEGEQIRLLARILIPGESGCGPEFTGEPG